MTNTPEEIIASQPAAADRDLTIQRDGQTQHTVQTISQSYPTTVDDLWQACTQADRLERWFAPVTGDLRLGGRYQTPVLAGTPEPDANAAANRTTAFYLGESAGA